MRTHTTIGAEILESGGLPVPAAARAIARHHHEHWDGHGYPDGLAGEAIPLAARITALADVYDALTHARPYKEAWSHTEAAAYISDQAGKHFDPRLVALFLEMIEPASANLAAFLEEAERSAATSAFAAARQVARAG